ncbi:Uncharacterised protein [uncultured archaeon]|nr:Uncharacterised protein [uncultured archaeon]
MLAGWTLAINLFTLPFVWFVFPNVIHSYYASLAVSEVFITLLEIAIWRQVMGPKHSVAWAVFLANLASFSIGLALAARP